ncbi:YceI family protein [Candidatus Sulfurimonas baltica]|uniref:YceI family protein n=1 Tax=Candidatus Sulfurimonas baltica TaxID=2740404 RepID=A0A7S7LX68_9BACT|nr:YceI family protein [Candidatus Sulfurimonas baltica]QOY52234.1 YceI family protein [Candidatus Sulfurimonas baltica]
MKVLTSLVVASIVGVSGLFGSNFNVDPSHTNVGFKVKHMMISNVNGKFNSFEGTFSIDDSTKKFTKIDAKVKVASISTENEDRDKHLRSADFFDVEKYPQMKLKLVEHNGDTALVELTIKDVTKTIKMDVEDISGMVKDPWGNVRTGFVLEGKIDRQEFNIKFSKLIETGALMVGNDVKIIIEAEGILTK